MPDPALPPRPAHADISAHAPDWSRERKHTFWAWAPWCSHLAALRSYQRWRESRAPWAALGRMQAVLRHRFWSVVTGADIPLNGHIAGGLVMPHPNGIVIHPQARIGPNCLLLQQVTLGSGTRPGLPHLVGHVDVGAGAKLLGGITIGAHARIGANAVVVDDVPAGATAVGIPARVVHPPLPPR